ncbi:hypothetical protein GOB33_22415 [Sinorhizobium meliloti]|nr:hypothetical protein [Sinorhizobium meliloti]
MDIEPIKAGKVYFFSSGEYSDYCICGHFVAIRDLSIDEMKAVADEVWRKAEEESPSEPRWRVWDATERKVIPELIRIGALIEVDAVEIPLYHFSKLSNTAP